MAWVQHKNCIIIWERYSSNWMAIHGEYTGARELNVPCHNTAHIICQSAAIGTGLYDCRSTESTGTRVRIHCWWLGWVITIFLFKKTWKPDLRSKFCFAVWIRKQKYGDLKINKKNGFQKFDFLLIFCNEDPLFYQLYNVKHNNF